MHVIRIPEEHWGKVWRTLIAAGPLTCVGPPPVYVISESQLRPAPQETSVRNRASAQWFESGPEPCLNRLAGTIFICR